MTKQYLLNNLEFVVKYDNERKDELVPGYKIQQRDPSIDWSHVEFYGPHLFQPAGGELQRIVDRFFDDLGSTWSYFLDELVDNGEIQDVPETFCW